MNYLISDYSVIAALLLKKFYLSTKQLLKNKNIITTNYCLVGLMTVLWYATDTLIQLPHTYTAVATPPNYTREPGQDYKA